MKEENFTLAKPELRKELPTDVVKYLEDTYPPRTNGAGLKQKDSVNYITEELDFLENETVNRCLEEQDGLKALGLLWFLRLNMANDLGWGLDITGKKRMLVFSQIRYFCNLEENEIEKLTNLLIDSGILKVVNGSDGKTYWTTLQQFYNYEYKSWTRLKNNFAKRKSYQKKHTQDKQDGVSNPDAYIQPDEDIPPIPPIELLPIDIPQTDDENEFF